MSEVSDRSDVHPDCQVPGPHLPHELASPGGCKPGAWCTGISDRGLPSDPSPAQGAGVEEAERRG